MKRTEVFGLIDAERVRQDVKFPGQWERFRAGPLDLARGGNAHTPADAPGRTAAFECLGILAEEFGEVANAIIERDDANLTVELVQCAAVIVAWLEGRA